MPLVQRLWSRLNFSVKFAVIMSVAGVLIAVIPLSLAGQQNNSQATERAADKAGVIVNLILGQEKSLAAFAGGMTQELAPALNSHDTVTLTSTLQRYSQVNTPSDVVGVHGSLADAAVVGGSAFSTSDPLYNLFAQQGRLSYTVLAGPDGAPWLVGASMLAGSDETAFIARPVDATFIQALAGTITTSADTAGVAIIRAGKVVTPGSSILNQTVTPGSAVGSAIQSALDRSPSPQVIDIGGQSTGVDVQPLTSGFAVLVTTQVTSATSLWQPALLLLGLIVVAMFCIVLVVQTDLQRPLRRLDRAVAAMAREDYDTPVPSPAGGEIGRLASSFEEMRRQLRATIAGSKARASIAYELNSPQPLETALGEVCAHLRRSAAADTAFILVSGSEMTDSFAVSDGAAFDIDVNEVLSGEGPIGTAHRNPGTDSLMAGAASESSEAQTGHREFCAAPLRMGRTVLGVLGLARARGGFSSGDAALVATSAEQVALALERYRFIAMVQRQASIDDLTGLYNHRFLVDYLGQQVALAERLNTPLAVLVLDLDHFKRVNDTHGHPVGDVVLTAFAHTLTTSIRRADLAARYGGEEFIVVMSNTAAPDARRVAEKIRSAVEALVVPVDSGGQAVTLTVSVGGAAYPEHTTTAQELLATADAALYDAKHGGRNRVSMAGDGDTEVEVPSNATTVVRTR
ncbi:MAG TPA: diguanylate cyclase [Candidatus Dormibacteraeota bacterium]|jgi:diguanylate cyclase (GGDEF)-like protein